jgi:hypothetical protein
MRYGSPASRRRSPSCAPRIARRSSCAAVSAIFGEHHGVGVRRGGAHLCDVRRLPGLRFVETFHADDGYIKALAQNVNDYWVKHGSPASSCFPSTACRGARSSVGDPYHCFCQMTGRLAGARARARPRQWTLRSSRASARPRGCSRTRRRCCGRSGKEGRAAVDVFCPGFVADCLETLEEIGIEGRALFTARRGEGIPCDSLPQRASALDRGAGRSRVSQSRGLVGAAAGRRRARA